MLLLLLQLCTKGSLGEGDAGNAFECHCYMFVLQILNVASVAVIIHVVVNRGIKIMCYCISLAVVMFAVLVICCFC